LMQKSLPLAGRVPRRFRTPMPRRDPGDFMVKLAEGWMGRRLPKNMHTGAAQGLQWAYGLTGPLALAGLGRALKLRSPGRTLAAGAAMGALVWAAGYLGWLPASGLTKPVQKMRAASFTSSLLSHLAYGALAALPLAVTARREV